MEHLQEIMTLLAKAQTGNVPFHQVVGKADALMQDGQSVILVCSGRSLDTVQMQQTLAMLHAKRMQVIVVLIETGGFGGKDHPGLLQLLAKSGVQHHRIGKGEAFSSLFPMQ